jgi:hypothetical protein
VRGAQNVFRQVLTAYTAARLKAYQTPRQPQLYRQTIDQRDRDQAELWSIASSALRAVLAFVVVINMMVDYDWPQTGFVKVNLNPIRVQLQSMQDSR